MPVIESIQNAGFTSLRGIADALSARGIKTAARGGDWDPRTVKNIIERAV